MVYSVWFFILLFSIDRRNGILLTMDRSIVERRCETICSAALNSRSTAAELHGIAKCRLSVVTSTDILIHSPSGNEVD